MDLQTFNFLLLFTHERAKTMAPMSLDSVQKTDLAKTGLFFYNNLIRCIGCRAIMDKIDAKQIKRHTYSDKCVSAINALLADANLRKQSFASFKWARRQFGSKHRLSDMLSRRGFYCLRKPARLRCANCAAVVVYVSVDKAQRAHKTTCAFRHVFDINLEDTVFAKVLESDLPPPHKLAADGGASAPAADGASATPIVDSTVSECKVCFVNEKSICFLPCRHLAVCATCSSRCKRCCVCNGKISSRIETLPQ